MSVTEIKAEKRVIGGREVMRRNRSIPKGKWLLAVRDGKVIKGPVQAKNYRIRASVREDTELYESNTKTELVDFIADRKLGSGRSS